MEPIDYTGALRRSWRLLLVLALLGGIVLVLIPASAPAKAANGLRWESTAVVGSIPSGGTNGGLLGQSVTSQQIYFLAQSSSVQGTTARSIGLNVPTAALPAYFTATIAAQGVTTLKEAQASTVTLKRNAATVVLLTGFGKTPAEAMQRANAYALEVDNAVGRVALERASAVAAAAAAKASASSSASASSDDGSTAPTSVNTGFQIQQFAVTAIHTGKKASLSSSRKVRLLAGLVIGAVIGAAIVLLRELLDKHLRSASRAEANFGFPVIVEVPAVPVKADQAARGITAPVDVVRDPDSAGAEAYRMLRMSVLFEALAPMSAPVDPSGYDFGATMMDAPRTGAAGTAPGVGERNVVMVVSAGTEPSRPHVAANLAAIYGEAGQRVIVISTGDIEAGRRVRLDDGRRPVILRDDVEAHLQPSRLEFVSRLPLGPFIANSGELVTRGQAVIDAARSLCDVLIVEVPPLLAVHHAEALAHAADVVLVVAESGLTTFSEARRAGDLLRRIEAPVLGVVFTNVRIDQRDVRLSVPRSAPQVPGSDEGRVREPVLALGPGSVTTSDRTSAPS